MRDAAGWTATEPTDAGARPRIRSDLHIEQREGRVVLFAQATQFVLRSPVSVDLVPLLDGTRRVAEVIAALKGRRSAPEILYTLNQLTAQGLVVWRPPLADAAQSAWADLAGLGAAAFARPIHLQILPGADGAALVAQLAAQGLSCVDANPAALRVVLAPDPLDPALAEVDRAARQDRQPWLLLAETGRIGQVGPFFAPDQAGCWQCLAHRMAEVRQAETWLAETWLAARSDSGAARPPRIGIPASRQAFAAFATIQILRNLDPATATLTGRLLRRDALDFEVSEHRLPTRPQCRHCGQAVHPGPRIVLDRAPAALAETAGSARLEALVDPVLGPVQSVADGLRTANDQIHTGIARHFFPMFKDEVKVLQRNLQGRSGGKGANAAEARTGALGEAVERYSGVWQGDWEQSRHGRAADLPGAVTLDRLLHFSAAQFAGRGAWNRMLKSPHQVVPEPLDPATPIDWTPAWSLTRDAVSHLPAAYCWYGHPELRRNHCFADSNGCAAASSRELALMKGLFELIERDAVALWWYTRAPRPAIDLSGFRDPGLHAVLARYDDLGRDVWALDVTTEFGLPVVVALSAQRDAATEDIVFGFGAGIDVRDALWNALGEMGQSYVFVSDRAADGTTRYRADNAEMLEWLKTATRQGQPWLCPASGLDPRGPDGLPRGRWDSPATAVSALTDRLAAEGIEVIALDQTRPDVGIPVMRTVAPGLRHFWRRLGPGRLYDAPVKLGWIETAPDEADLNPFSIFI